MRENVSASFLFAKKPKNSIKLSANITIGRLRLFGAKCKIETQRIC